MHTKGSEQHPVYAWLTQRELNGKLDSEVKWNFQKYLIDADGTLHTMLASGTSRWTRRCSTGSKEVSHPGSTSSASPPTRRRGDRGGRYGTAPWTRAGRGHRGPDPGWIGHTGHTRTAGQEAGAAARVLGVAFRGQAGLPDGFSGRTGEPAHRDRAHPPHGPAS